MNSIGFSWVMLTILIWIMMLILRLVLRLIYLWLIVQLGANIFMRISEYKWKLEQIKDTNVIIFIILWCSKGSKHDVDNILFPVKDSLSYSVKLLWKLAYVTYGNEYRLFCFSWWGWDVWSLLYICIGCLPFPMATCLEIDNFRTLISWCIASGMGISCTFHLKSDACGNLDYFPVIMVGMEVKYEAMVGGR